MKRNSFSTSTDENRRVRHGEPRANARFKLRDVLVLTIIVILAGLSQAALYAQEAGAIVIDEDALFGEDITAPDETAAAEAENAGGSGETGLITEAESADTASSASTETFDTALLTSDAVVVGGTYAFEADAAWYWNDITTFFPDITAYDRVSASADVSADVYLDARPYDDFRVFLKAGISYSPSLTQDGAGAAAETDLSPGEVFTLKELWSDFNWNNRLFFRAGKQTLNWGVGYFFSPANLLNITQVDPEDPEAELEGPVALKINLPIGVHNLYLYGLAKDITLPEQYGVALKGEFVVGGTEFGIGGLYQADIPPAAMATVSTSLGDFSLFGEAVLSCGSARTFVVEDADAPFGVSTALYDAQAFFSGTAGALYSYSNDEGTFNFSVAGQYFYNGEGYAEPAILTDNQAAVGALLQAGSLSAADLMRTGRHYAALNTGLSDIGGTGLSFSVFWMQNFSDLSGMVTPALSWQPKQLDEIAVSLKVPMTYGDAGKELSINGNTIGVSLNFSLGGGSF